MKTHRLIPHHGRGIPSIKRVLDDIYNIALVAEEDSFSKEKWDAFRKDINNVGIVK